MVEFKDTPEEAPTESSTGLTLEQVEEMSLYDMLLKWRRSPAGTFVRDDVVTKAFIARMVTLQQENPGAYVAASKAIGW